MKKLFAMLFALVMVISMAACTPNDTPDPSDDGVDMSQFPAKFEDWDANDLNKYFAAAGVYAKEDWIYVQPHAEYYPGTAVNDGCGYMDTDGMIMIVMFTFDKNSTEADVPAYMEFVRTNKKLDDEMGALPIDHMLGHVAFCTSYTVDEDVYNAMEAAIQQLAKDVGIELDF